MTISVSLEEPEKRIGMLLAKARYANSRKNKLQKTKLPSISVLEPDIEGAMSELALCKLLGVYPQTVFEIGIRSAAKGTDTGDVVFGGLTLDAKSTKHKNGKLFCMKENKAVDVYVLMIGHRGEYDIAGCMYAKDLVTPDRWGHHKVFKIPCYAAEQKELLSLEEVFPSLTKAYG
mgnify:FL=1